jgi:leucyl-tRNA synthetase
LSDFLAQPLQREALARWTALKNERSSKSDEFLNVYERDGVRRATVEIDSDARALAAWENASLSSMARKLYEFERRTNGFLHHLHAQQLTLLRALEQATTLEELKAAVLETIRDKDSADAYVQQTRKAIEAGTDEFAHPEGLAK